MLVLLLGAGFSSYAGLPTMAQFGGVFHERLQRVMNAANAIDPDTRIPRPIMGAARLQAAGEVYGDFRDYCRGALRFMDIEYNNLEELFCAAEAMKEAKSKPIPLAHGRKSIDKIIIALRLWTWNIYQGLPDYFAHSSKVAVKSNYSDFMDWLKLLPDPATVLTTNYDLLFEQIAIRAKVPLQHPFKAPALWVKERRKTYLKDSSDAIVLCKLHGSVSFFTPDPKSTEIRICSEVLYDEDGAVGNSQVVPGRRPHPTVICLGALGCLRKDHRKSLTPAIIPPTYAKLQETKWLRATWKKAVEALQEAKVLVIIGYSFPSSDGFMRAMFLSAMAQRDQNKPLRVLLVTPDKDAAARVADLFRPVVEESGFLWRARRFEDWSPSDDPKLKSWLR